MQLELVACLDSYKDSSTQLNFIMLSVRLAINYFTTKGFIQLPCACFCQVFFHSDHYFHKTCLR